MSKRAVLCGAGGTTVSTSVENVTRPTWFSLPPPAEVPIASSSPVSPSFTCSIGSPSIDPDVSTTNVTIAGFLTSPHESMMCVSTSGCRRPGWIVARGSLASRPHDENRSASSVTPVPAAGRNPAAMKSCCWASARRKSTHSPAAAVSSAVTHDASTIAAGFELRTEPSFG